MTDATTIEEKIAECWARGDGIKETRIALKRLGFDVSAEQVRLRFVALAGEWVG